MPRSGERTRKRIVNAGYRLLRRKGFTRVSMDDIAAAAAVTKRTVYQHFESKDAPVGAVLAARHGSRSPPSRPSAIAWPDRPRR